MSDYIEQVFGDAGTLSRHIPGYAQRDGQVQLARAIDQTIVQGGVLLGEAPCGVGKTMAYAAPAIVHALRSGHRALIVTANKALQEQLIDKDLPLLTKALKDIVPAFRFKLLKGRSNYLCQRDFGLYDRGDLGWPSSLDRNEVDALRAWAMITPTGDRSDAPSAIPDKLWRVVSVAPDDCDHRACPSYETCFAEKAAEEAEGAHVVVANYDLLYYKLANGRDASWFKFGCVILDEVHEAAEIARRCLGSEVNEFAIRRLATALTDKLGERGAAKRLRDTASPLFEKVARYAATHGRAPRLSDPGFVNAEDLVDALTEAAGLAEGACPQHAGSITPHCADCKARELVRERATSLAVRVQEIVEQKDESTAYWLEKPQDDTRLTGATVKLCAAPYHVGERLTKLIFAKFRAVIGVSATLTSSGTFDYIQGELGLSMTAPRTIRVPSPFDFRRQARFVVPLGVPFPTRENEAAFDAAAVEAIAKLVHDCRGRLLGLFTSWRRLKYVADKLRDRIDYPLLCQGDAPNKQLAQMFRETTDSVLLATRSFWMGLDVPGESLSCLVIDKLPFPNPDDPFVDMMKTKHPETYYQDFYVPRAVIALAQGAGRLIRSQDDYGALVLLDQRIKTGKYRMSFLRSLPFGDYSQNLDDVGKFLANGGSR
jgi:ATP-dependent DNA helicase DinG